ncbi:apolipoprotein acyltransferase [Pseudosulfitobacter sp. SM2401]|jgi:hypothetical protein|uniref:apolipoprotein acyltransferase n=1 Tax=Pseudosulfitobacter sp. SM2401 TaxID=3350098 RepID=UPI002A2B662B|nr:apolipoprotein acyltransferase [Ascidiaceihabitans sp.]
MIVIIAALLGAIVGAFTAKRRKGNTLDILQYAAGYAMAFVVVGMIATVVLHRLAV